MVAAFPSMKQCARQYSASVQCLSLSQGLAGIPRPGAAELTTGPLAAKPSVAADSSSSASFRPDRQQTDFTACTMPGVDKHSSCFNMAYWSSVLAPPAWSSTVSVRYDLLQVSMMRVDRASQLATTVARALTSRLLPESNSWCRG
jgi:hypothetical protein